ncbi:MAG: carbamoyltransferase HypF [Bacteroidales bacterium]|nr:MAG: carbamoyltransferase HypF [Bacteroidales bacterium]
MALLKHLSYRIQVKGLVQGVGFRPFIYRIARKHKLNGWVENRNDGVIIRAEGEFPDLEGFMRDLETDAPLASRILSVTRSLVEPELIQGFEILGSSDISEEITEVSPDIAVCSDCLEDMEHQEHRIDYPFINCTNCGPRFTIIEDLPYDRNRTTMSVFKMCSVCESEYKNILDRRFHAQPVACLNCGPQYRLIHNGEEYADLGTIIPHVARLIHDGEILAIKGLGGFFIACDATNEEAVRRLRIAKDRDGKPFAVMFSDLTQLKSYAIINKTEESVITSWRRPIVLVQAKKHLAPDVSVGFKTIGAMLPYMPAHYMLFSLLDIPAIVLTSGNISEQPILIDNEKAMEKLSGRVDALLDYDRNIYNRTDDSVVMVVNDRVRKIRRSRGYVPTPIRVRHEVDRILATGAELVNCFCIGKGRQAIMSQHIGDLKNLETYRFYTESIKQFMKIFRVEPHTVVCDMHPDYLSTKYALESGLETIRVQHHHAHIASCMAEYGLDEKVIGVSFDGIGYGDDQNIWGGEFLICGLADYTRPCHFEYIPMPGGDKATEEPWRMAISYLYRFFGEEFLSLNLPFIQKIRGHDIQLILEAIRKKINCPLTSSAGRLFDAIAAITSLCTHSDFHAEAPMRLESIIEQGYDEEYGFRLQEKISFEETIRGVVADVVSNVPRSVISARFHNTIISLIFAAVSDLAGKSTIRKVVLSGGTFQNKYILERIENRLKKEGLEVFIPHQVPANDGGIALGQLIVAAKRKEISCV